MHISLMMDTSKPQALKVVQEHFMHYATVITPQTTHVMVLGGDGFMLSCLQAAMNQGFALYGLNFGTRGFLMNTWNPDVHLETMIHQSVQTILHPLHIHMTDWHGNTYEAFAFNEMALLRASGQAVKVKIAIDHVVRLPSLMGDGIILATPMGSSAYNYAAQGPMVPINSYVLPLTPMNPHHPKRWPGALLAQSSHFSFQILEPEKRPAQVSLDGITYVDIVTIKAHLSQSHHAKVLFHPTETLEERMIAHQFAV